MSNITHFAPFVKITLLKKVLTKVMSAVGVPTDFVSACSESRLMCFVFIWFQITAEAPVRDVFSSVHWYLIVCDEKDCVGGVHSALLSSNALR